MLGQKKRSFSFFFNFFNFDDILTLIQSKERKKYEVFVEKKICNKKPKMTQKMKKKRNDKKKFLVIFVYPRSKIQIFRGRSTRPPYKVKIGLHMLIPVILSYTTAKYDHFRQFYEHLKKFVSEFFRTKNIRDFTLLLDFF